MPKFNRSNESKSSSQSDTVFPFGPYQGRFSIENLVFNANLQEFTQQINKIADSHRQGHIASDEVLLQLEKLWQQLKNSKQKLGISS